MKCKNCDDKYYTGEENTPLGRGYSASVEKVGTEMKGKDRKMYVVKKYKNGKRWVRISSASKQKNPQGWFDWGKRKKKTPIPEHVEDSIEDERLKTQERIGTLIDRGTDAQLEEMERRLELEEMLRQQKLDSERKQQIRDEILSMEEYTAERLDKQSTSSHGDIKAECPGLGVYDPYSCLTLTHCSSSNVKNISYEWYYTFDNTGYHYYFGQEPRNKIFFDVMVSIEGDDASNFTVLAMPTGSSVHRTNHSKASNVMDIAALYNKMNFANTDMVSGGFENPVDFGIELPSEDRVRDIFEKMSRCFALGLIIETLGINLNEWEKFYDNFLTVGPESHTVYWDKNKNV